MPLIPFEELPDRARLWTFAASRRLTDQEALRMLAATEEFLARWTAHRVPLATARPQRLQPTRAWHVEGDLPLMAYIFGQIDHRHSAFAQLAFDTVAAFEGSVQAGDWVGGRHIRQPRARLRHCGLKGETMMKIGESAGLPVGHSEYSAASFPFR